MFAMASGYEATAGMKAWLTGTPGVLSMVAVEPGVAMVAEAGVAAIRAKSVQLTDLAAQLYDQLLSPLGFGLSSPRDASRRGSHLTVSHPDAQALTTMLLAEDVVADFRGPDGIRIGLAPLTTRYVDVFDGISRLTAVTTCLRARSGREG
jgi:kynureninase